MANATSVAQWKQAVADLNSQVNQLAEQIQNLQNQRTDLESQSNNLSAQLQTTTDPVQTAQLKSQINSIQPRLQQLSIQISETQTQAQTVATQLGNAETELNTAKNGTTGAEIAPAPVQALDITPTQTQTVTKVEVTPPAVVVTGTAYDDNGFLNPGWTLDENNNPVRVDNNFVEQATVNSAKESYYSAANKNGTAYDDNGFLNPGWTLDENNNPVYVGGSFVEQATIDSAKESYSSATNHGLAYDDAGNLMPGWQLSETNDPVWVGLEKPLSQGGPKDGAQSSAGGKVAAKNSNSVSGASTGSADDWRVRLSLASKANYLYNVATEKDILFPLKGTNGVVFPYTPQVNTSYRANYDPAELTHNNYKMYFYKNSSIDDVTITADFTAQDTREANYMLAVIHFFKSVTKMFYGQDISPRPGTPPPLVYLTGFGSFQFDNHPMAVTNFQYNLPNDVDYIRAGATKSWGGSSITSLASQGKATTASKIRAALSGLKVGATTAAPQFTNLSSKEATYVPTKIQLSITLIPIVTRGDISKRFSLTDYATGKLLQGSKNSGGGIW